jgi:hypothetical protein
VTLPETLSAMQRPFLAAHDLFRAAAHRVK